MNRNRFVWLVYLLYISRVLATDLNVAAPISGIGKIQGEFGLCFAADRRSIDSNWKYLIRYINFEPSSDENFHLALVKVEKNYRLALYEGIGKSVDELDVIPIADKLGAAVAVTDIDVKLAEQLYAVWVSALAHARYGSGAYGVGARDYFYISAFGIDVGYMCGDSCERLEDGTTGIVIKIGKLLRKYSLCRISSEQESTKTEIEKLCGSYLTRSSIE